MMSSQSPSSSNPLQSIESYQQLIRQLDLMIRARYPLLYCIALEEDPIEQVLRQVASQFQPPRDILFWDLVRGWSDNKAHKGSVMGALERIANTSFEDNTIFVLRNLHLFLKQPYTPQTIPIVQELINLTRDLKTSRKTLVVTGYNLELPLELREQTTVIDFPFPSAQEIDYLISKIVAPENLQVAGLGRERLVKACQGLSRTRIERILAKALADKEQVNESDIDMVLEEKKQVIRQTEILEFLSTKNSLKNVGGLDNLKQWVRMRQDAFTEEARNYGIPNPKGILLVGIQGTGKSLCANTIAHEWRLPLLRLDAGRLFGGIVGESENRARQMIKLAEAMAPCILWIDEIDKAFGNITSGADGDSGTSRRVFGSLITWMQEKTSPVFIVATANNVRILPAELLRKGRFDEIFFVNLPTEAEREEIFKVHLQRIRPNRWRSFDLPLLANLTRDFSGAEIEQVIIDGMHRAFNGGRGQQRDFTTEDILMAVKETVPLAAIAYEQITALKQWAAQTGARTASNDGQLLEELRQYTIQRGIEHPELD